MPRWMPPERRQGRRRLLACATCLLLMCSPLLAEQPAPTSQAPSDGSQMVPLETCLSELTKLEQTAREQVAELTKRYDERLTRLATDYETRLREAVVQAAAEAAKPLLAELAAAKAERDVAVANYHAARTRGTVAWVLSGILGALLAGTIVVHACTHVAFQGVVQVSP